MRIIENQDDTSFALLPQGAVFRSCETKQVYIKIYPINIGDSDTANAINLFDGRWAHFNESYSVLYHKDATLLLYGTKK